MKTIIAVAAPKDSGKSHAIVAAEAHFEKEGIMDGFKREAVEEIFTYPEWKTEVRRRLKLATPEGKSLYLGFASEGDSVRSVNDGLNDLTNGLEQDADLIIVAACRHYGPIRDALHQWAKGHDCNLIWTSPHWVEKLHGEKPADALTDPLTASFAGQLIFLINTLLMNKSTGL